MATFINDVSIREGDAGTKVMTFTVGRVDPLFPTMTVTYSTSDGTAIAADGDYVATSGTLFFGPGVTTRQISVIINGDRKFEPDESFFVNISADDGDFTDRVAIGTILNDDPPPPPMHATARLIDLDGDGKSDVVWRDDAGLDYAWLMNGLGIKGEGAQRTVDTSWHMRGGGDFNGDGKDDILWRQDGGQVYLWNMDGTAIKSEGAVRQIENFWRTEGTGDFNGTAGMTCCGGRTMGRLQGQFISGPWMALRSRAKGRCGLST